MKKWRAAETSTTLLQHLRDDLRCGEQDPVVLAQEALGRANKQSRQEHVSLGRC